MVWYNTFDSVFWLGVMGGLAGVIGLCLKNCVKTKCKSIDLCYGFFKIERDVGIESTEEIRAMELRAAVQQQSGSPRNSSFTLHTPTRKPLNNNII